MNTDIEKYWTEKFKSAIEYMKAEDFMSCGDDGPDKDTFWSVCASYLEVDCYSPEDICVEIFGEQDTPEHFVKLLKEFEDLAWQAAAHEVALEAADAAEWNHFVRSHSAGRI